LQVATSAATATAMRSHFPAARAAGAHTANTPAPSMEPMPSPTAPRVPNTRAGAGTSLTRRAYRARMSAGIVARMSRVFRIPFASVDPLYIQKLERKGRTREELHEVIEWLTGFDEARLQHHIDAGSTLEEFFADATINPAASSITGMICGMRVEEIE